MADLVPSFACLGLVRDFSFPAHACRGQDLSDLGAPLRGLAKIRQSIKFEA